MPWVEDNFYRGENKGERTVNHWVHMVECHQVNMEPGLLMLLAGKQAGHRLKRIKQSPTTTPALFLFYVLEESSV